MRGMHRQRQETVTHNANSDLSQSGHRVAMCEPAADADVDAESSGLVVSLA